MKWHQDNGVELKVIYDFSLRMIKKIGANYNLTSHKVKNPEIVAFMNDIDRDGDNDIFLLRTNSGQTTLDVLINNSNKNYETNTEFSRKLTSIIKSNNLRYLGLLDLDSDSWSDIVFSDDNNDLYILKIRNP